MVSGVFMTLMCSEIKDARPATGHVILLLSTVLMMQSIATDDRPTDAPRKLTLRLSQTHSRPAWLLQGNAACRIMSKIH